MQFQALLTINFTASFVGHFISFTRNRSQAKSTSNLVATSSIPTFVFAELFFAISWSLKLMFTVNDRDLGAWKTWKKFCLPLDILFCVWKVRWGRYRCNKKKKCKHIFSLNETRTRVCGGWFIRVYIFVKVDKMIFCIFWVRVRAWVCHCCCWT